MADIDLKAATPDTSLPSTGFLFGADSQSAASPSVYSTQTVATALLGSTALTGGTATTSTPILDMAQTWNAGAVSFTGWKLNVTDTASASGSLLIDLQVGGSSKFSIRKDGTTTTSGNIQVANNAVYVEGTTVGTIRVPGVGGYYGWTTNTASTSASTIDLFLTRRAAANLRLGAADAAAPVAQTLSVQSVVAGTTNTAGVDLTITGSQGTGTGAGGSIIFRVAPAGSSGTAQNALATALTIASNLDATFGLNVRSTTPFPRYGGATGIVLAAGATDLIAVIDNFTTLQSGAALGWSSTGAIGTQDTILRRDAANTLAQRNGANAQTKRIYGTYTDASNYRRLAMTMSTAGVAEIKPEGAGTGASGNVIHISGLPTSNPGPGILWNNAGTPAIGT